uniref:RNA-binding protein with serine-rich domain 1 n=1 Tax=Rugamonas rivuli TaxID=2743358 RepID=UPI001C2D4CEF|nr:RNA-binding protein with serine-rich domain 1 [Rugamonas rivuli]
MAEYLAMLATGMVQESFSGTTHVLVPPDRLSFQRRAKRGQVYVEFEVPSDCLKRTSTGWAKIVGPQSLQGRNAARKKQMVPQMPAASNIRLVASKSV